DALEAIHPGELARMVEEAVRPYRDESLEERLGDAEERARNVIEGAWGDQVAEHRDELERLERRAQEIVDCYRPSLANLNTMLQADLAPVRARMEQLRHTIAEIVTRFQEDPPVLPKRPEPE